MHQAKTLTLDLSRGERNVPQLELQGFHLVYIFGLFCKSIVVIFLKRKTTKIFVLFMSVHLDDYLYELQTLLEKKCFGFSPVCIVCVQPV